MSTKGNARKSLPATSIFFECKTNDKNISKPTKRQRKDPESQVLVVNTETLSWLSQETLQIPTIDFRCSKKLGLELNSLNDKKARYKSHETFL